MNLSAHKTDNRRARPRRSAPGASELSPRGWARACWRLCARPDTHEEIGYPEHRPRTLMTGGLHSTVACLLPDDAELVKSEFMEFLRAFPSTDRLARISLLLL